jgi:hypothetical protein
VGKYRRIAGAVERTDYRWEALAFYNAECSRGIVHTLDYDVRMLAEQHAFDQYSIDQMTAQGWERVSDPDFTGATVWQFTGPIPQPKRRLRRLWHFLTDQYPHDPNHYSDHFH